ncbi:SPOR domain-containing protein [Thalassotalea agariperforans]
MSTPFQNRLVGTVMVAAAAVIFLPDFLDGKKQQYQVDFTDIPQAPSIESAPENKAFPEDKIAQLPKEKIDKAQALADVFEQQKYNQIADEDNATELGSSQQITTSKVKINTLDKSDGFTASGSEPQVAEVNKTEPAEIIKQPEQTQWVVQLGSFRHEKNVKVLVEKLTDNGFNVFTRPIKTKNGSLTKVFVGPELVKSVLEKKLPKLKELTKVDGKVARY